MLSGAPEHVRILAQKFLSVEMPASLMLLCKSCSSLKVIYLQCAWWSGITGGAPKDPKIALATDPDASLS